jgi:hypothetical protein
MVSLAYLLKPPSAIHRFVNQRALPVLIDAAGAVELQLEQVAIAARTAPLACLVVAAGAGYLARTLLGNRNRRYHRR